MIFTGEEIKRLMDEIDN